MSSIVPLACSRGRIWKTGMTLAILCLWADGGPRASEERVWVMYGVCTEQALSKRLPMCGPHHLCHQDCHPYCDQELRLHQAQERAPSDLEKLPPLRAREHVLGLARHPSPSLRAGWQRPRPRPHFQTQLCSGVPRSTSHLTGPHHLHFFLQSPFNPQRTASGTSLIFSGAETPGFIFNTAP